PPDRARADPPHAAVPRSGRARGAQPGPASCAALRLRARPRHADLVRRRRRRPLAAHPVRRPRAASRASETHRRRPPGASQRPGPDRRPGARLDVMRIRALAGVLAIGALLAPASVAAQTESAPQVDIQSHVPGLTVSQVTFFRTRDGGAGYFGEVQNQTD